ncbi:AimR family lysis-lysogeny pheromone receptor [Niallia sp. 03190]|uniref:AimR family lysis-lysogeny pheromone receptor n=1 Tax=Niallia sp. 03190 TaxID=3458061 RepID=UPI004044D11A
MKKLMGKIKQDKMKKKITNKVVANKIRTSEGTVTNYLKGSYKVPFHKFKEIIKMIYEDDYKYINSLIEEYLNKIDKSEYIKEAIEWFFSTGQNKKAEVLIKNNIRRSQEDPTFEIYEMLCNRSMGIIKKEEFYKKINNIKLFNLDDDSLALLKVADMISHFDFKAYQMLSFLADEGIEHLKKIKNEYFSKAFELRMFEIKAGANLLNINLSETKEICLSMIEKYSELDFPIPISSFYYILAQVYLFDDYEKSIEYNNKAFEIISQTQGECEFRLKGLKESHDLISIHHNKFDNLFLGGQSEKAHMYARKGDVKKAITILNELEKAQGHLTAYQTYYKGLALMNEEILKKSRDMFISTGNLFWAQLADIKLKK